MQRVRFQFNRRTRERIFRATALLSLALWLFMAVAENCKPLHEWLHGGSIPDNDDCAVVAIAQGKIETIDFQPPVFIPMTGIEIILRAEISVFVPASKNLPPSRAPPVPCSVS
jgi:hypothetical protein